MTKRILLLSAAAWFFFGCLVAPSLYAAGSNSRNERVFFAPIYVRFVFKPSLGSKPWVTVLSSIVMGCAVSGMHYTAMSAARFYPSDLTSAPGTALPHSFMVISICGIMALAVGMTLIGTIVDQRLVEAAEALRRCRDSSSIPPTRESWDSTGKGTRPSSTHP